MSENKCPMGCGGNLVNARVSEVAFECTQCYFRCHKGHLPHIAAAMELAKKLSKIHELGHKRPTSDSDKYNERVTAMSEALEDYQSAKDRVLEVWNG